MYRDIIVRVCYGVIISLCSLMVTNTWCQAQTFTLNGSIKKPQCTSQMQPQSISFWHEANGYLSPRKEREDTTCVSIVLTREAHSPKPNKININLVNGNFSNQFIVIAPNSQVTVKNLDAIDYHLFSPEDASIKPAALEPRQSRPIRSEVEGAIRINDSHFAHVQLHIIKLEHMVSSQSLEKNNEFSFKELGAGDYTLHVYEGTTRVHTQQVSTEDLLKDSKSEIDSDAMNVALSLKPIRIKRKTAK